MSGKRSNIHYRFLPAPFFWGPAPVFSGLAPFFRGLIISLSVIFLLGGTTSSSAAQSYPENTGAGPQKKGAGDKSVVRAFFYSFLVPGLGQKYVNNIGSARYFIATEAVMFGLAAGHELYSDWLEEDYQAFAAVHAGIDPAGKSKNYFIEISRFNSIYIFNKNMRLNRDFQSVIPETPENIWVWDSKENRLKFHDKRVDADRMQNRTIYFYTGIFLNHVVSGIHAAIKAKRYNGQSGESNFNVKFLTTNPVNPTHKLVLSFRF